MLRETCELTPPISNKQQVMEQIASLVPPLAIVIVIRDLFSPIKQEELCSTEVLNMEDIINLTMNFLVEDWLEDEGDSDFVDYLYAMGIHQHQSHAHPVGDWKKREARRFFKTARGPTIIRPKYVKKLMATTRPGGKKGNFIPKNIRIKRSIPNPRSMQPSDLERKWHCISLQHRGYPRAMLQKCKAFLSSFKKLMQRPKRSVKTGFRSSRMRRGYGGVSPPRTQSTVSGGTRSRPIWRKQQTGNRNSPSPDRNRNNFMMRNRNRVPNNNPSGDLVVFKRRSSSVSSNTRRPNGSLRRVNSQGGTVTFSDITISRWRSMPALMNPRLSQKLPKPKWYKVPGKQWKQFATVSDSGSGNLHD